MEARGSGMVCVLTHVILKKSSTRSIQVSAFHLTGKENELRKVESLDHGHTITMTEQLGFITLKLTLLITHYTILLYNHPVRRLSFSRWFSFSRWED